DLKAARYVWAGRWPTLLGEANGDGEVAFGQLEAESGIGCLEHRRDELGVRQVKREIASDAAEYRTAEHVSELAHDLAGSAIRDIQLLSSEKSCGQTAGRALRDADRKNAGGIAAEAEAGGERGQARHDAAARARIEDGSEKH